MHESIATITSPEFINLQPIEINPLMSSCEIKVCYLGENRNRSYISKEVATKMAKTLRGAPIVGYYKQPKEDFADHGELVTVDDEGIHFDCLTKPYGFVSPDAKVWFQTFDDTDEFGNIITRTYLMTNGYLWTGQFEECKSVIENGKNQSMELDEKTLDGKWATNNNSGIEFFIINDATFSKLCILGDDVEPCFEGARITKPEVSASFSLDKEFKTTLYQMMQELHFALKGGKSMENNEILDKIDENVEVDFEETTEEVEEISTNFEEEATTEEAPVEEPEEEVVALAEESEEEEETPVEPNDEDDIDEKKKVTEEEFALVNEKLFALQEAYDALLNDFNSLNAENSALKEFKLNIENREKDAKIAEFSMLEDSDKAEVIANKANLSIDEIESKLATICYKKKINFTLLEESQSEPVVYAINSDETLSVPAWVSELNKNK